MESKKKAKLPDFLIAPLELVQDHRLTLMQTRILLALLSFRNKQTNTVFPKRESLAERAGYSIAVISRTTTQLVNLGWLKKVGDGGRRRASHYEIMVPDLDTKTVTESVTVTEPVTVTESATQTVTESVTPRVTESVRGNKEQTNRTDKGTDKKINKKEPAITKLIPKDVDDDVWCAFIDFRKKQNAQLTNHAAKLIAKKLASLNGCPNEILNQSIMNGWKGVFSIKPEPPQPSGKSAAQIATENFHKKHGIGVSA